MAHMLLTNMAHVIVDTDYGTLDVITIPICIEINNKS